jgi:hypothetical protein
MSEGSNKSGLCKRQPCVVRLFKSRGDVLVGPFCCHDAARFYTDAVNKEECGGWQTYSLVSPDA